MKKIILNGCSWIAGDEIVWKEFCEEKGLENEDFMTFSERYGGTEKKHLITYYRTVWRKNHNQGSMLSRMLETQVIDLAIDGNSNDGIALGTINYVNTIPVNERKDYHVVIGWTILERKALWLDYYWDNCNYSHYTEKQGNWSRWKNRILGGIIENTDNDWYLSYYKNVIMLESFLKSNDMTYTFYRSLGSKDQFFFRPDKIGIIKSKMFYTRQPIPISTLNFHNLRPEFIDKDNWFVFFDRDTDLPFCSDSWTRYCESIYDFDEWVIRPENRHPNKNCTENLSKRLSDFILERKYLE